MNKAIWTVLFMAIGSLPVVRAEVSLNEALDNPDLVFNFSGYEGDGVCQGQTEESHDGADAVRISGRACELTIGGFVGPGTLSFWWRKEPSGGLYVWPQESAYNIRVLEEWTKVELDIYTPWHECVIKRYCWDENQDGYGLVDQMEWTPAVDPIKVKFSPGAGQKDIEVFYDPGAYYGEMPRPTRDGWTFYCWCQDKEGTELVDAGEYVPLKGATVYAKWVKPLAEVMDTPTMKFTTSSANPWMGTDLVAPNGGPVAQAHILEDNVTNQVCHTWTDPETGVIVTNCWVHVYREAVLKTASIGRGFLSFYSYLSDWHLDFKVNGESDDFIERSKRSRYGTWARWCSV